tara:strand:+ start:37 stop:1626 length:1590 start_codon:yes stop_codon:yes gene_type:complete
MDSEVESCSSKGCLLLLLHAHLPFARNPEVDVSLSERWYFQAINEVYIPHLKLFSRLYKDKVPFRITYSLSPTLLMMFQDAFLNERYLEYMDKMILLAEKEVKRTDLCENSALHELSESYLNNFKSLKRTFVGEYDQDLAGAFKVLSEQGCLELITTSVTHAYLPLYKKYPNAISAQVEAGVECFEKIMGFAPEGFWLPECGYFKGIEDVLKSNGIRYFFLEGHAVSESKNAQYSPVACSNGVVGFGRDELSSSSVWDSKSGYPSDIDYREYYNDIGFDLTIDELSPLIVDQSERSNTGIKYLSVSGKAEGKSLYSVSKAANKVEVHARDFILKKRSQILKEQTKMGLPPVIVAPYDAELFGHWWHEGVDWLEKVIRYSVKDQGDYSLVTGSDYLRENSVFQCIQPIASSWGENASNEFWINEENDWMYPYLFQASEDLNELKISRNLSKRNSLIERALRQAQSLLFLAQASDLAFMVRAKTTSDYAIQRFKELLSRFYYLKDLIEKNKLNVELMDKLEELDKFPCQSK